MRSTSPALAGFVCVVLVTIGTAFFASELEEFAHAFDLGAAYGNFGVLLVVHFQHEGGVEPRHYFLDVMNVHQERAAPPPKGIRIQRFFPIFEYPVISTASH